jgi:hypothetical protein
MSRYALPSIRTKLTNGCARRVQWRVTSSVSRSDMDQMLKYGSLVTKGTAGGRNAKFPPGGSAGSAPPPDHTGTTNPTHIATTSSSFPGRFIGASRSSLESRAASLPGPSCPGFGHDIRSEYRDAL